MPKTRTLIIAVVLVFTALLGGGAAWLFLNQDRLAGALIERLEAHLLTDAHIDHIELDLWSHFPHVSLVLHDTWLLGSHAPNDTLMQAEELAVACNAFDLIRGNYRLNALDVRNGTMALASSATGWNTRVWKQSEGEAQSESFAIEQLALHGLRLQVDANRVDVEQAELQLNWTETGIDVSGSGAFSTVATPDFDTDKRLEWSGQGVWDSTEDTAQIALSSVEWNGLDASAEIHVNEGWSVHSELKGVTLAALRDAIELPSALQDLQTNAQASGSVDWDGSLFRSNWVIPPSRWAIPYDDQNLTVNGSARLWLKYEKGSWRADAPAVEVRTNGAEWAGKVERILLETGSFEATGAAAVDWAEADLPVTLPFDFPDRGQTKWEGMVKRKQNGAFDWAGTWNASGCEGRYNDVQWAAEGSGTLDGNELAIDTLRGTWDGIELHAAVRGGLPNGASDGLTWSGSVHVPAWATSSADTGAVLLSSFQLPRGVQTDLAVTVGNIRYGGWDLNTVQFRLQGDAGAWVVPNFQAETLGGRLVGDGSCTFHADNASATVRVHPAATGCDLPTLFEAFDDFDQTTLRAEHLRGTFDASGSVQFTVDERLEWDSNTLDVLGSAAIHEGQLSNLEAFQEIADYLRSNRLMAPLVDPDDLSARLVEVQFEHVESPVYISKGIVQLPPTSIRSSAMDITLAGAYQFDSSIDYTLGFAMRDLRSTEDSEFGTIQDDGLGHQFFVSMTGTVDEPKYGWDREAQKNHRKENLQREKDLLKELFRKSKP